MSKYKVSPPDKRRWRGVTYDSRAEMRYAQHLDMRKRGESADMVEIVEQPRVFLSEDVSYRPDFFVVPVAAQPYYIDVKGMQTQKFKRDKKAWARHGWLPLHIVKEKSAGRFETVEIVYPEKD